MAVELERLIVTLEARFDEYNRNLQQAQATTNTRLRDIERRFDRTTNKIGRGAAQSSDAMKRGFRGAATSATLLVGPLSGVGARMTAISGTISRGNAAWAGFALTLGATTFAAYKALAAFQEFETQSLVLEQVLRATGGSSGKTAKEIEDLAQSIASATLASTQGVRKAAATMLTFRTVTGDTFDRALKAAQDLAAVGFGTIETAAVQLGKALEDPTTGLSALRRVGVSFSESQKLVITRMLETGRVAEAQGEILKGIENQVGGAGASAAKGLAGAYDTLAQSTDNLLTSWGKQISKGIGLAAAIKGIAGAIDDVNKATGGGSLEVQLDEVNKRIAGVRNDLSQEAKLVRGIASSIGLEGFSVEEEINELLGKRFNLQRQLFAQRLERLRAERKAVEAQKKIADDQAKGIIKGLKDELDLTGKVAVERRKIDAFKKAGVDGTGAAGSGFRKEISEIVEQITKADLVFKNFIDTQSRLAQTGAEIDVIGRSDFDAARKLLIQQRLNEAKVQGIDLTKEEIDTIKDQAATIARAETELQNLRNAYQEVSQQSKEALSSFLKDMKDGVSAGEALANVLNKIADKLIDMAVNDLVETALGGLTGRGGNAQGAGQASALASLFGFSEGGKVDGPGTGTSDSIPARLSKGEYVVNAEATKRFQPMLEAINSGRVPKFAEGGPIAIPRVAIPAAAPASPAAPAVTINATFNLENATPAAVDRAQTEMVPKIKQLVRNEVAQVFDRKARFSRSGI